MAGPDVCGLKFVPFTSMITRRQVNFAAQLVRTASQRLLYTVPFGDWTRRVSGQCRCRMRWHAVAMPMSSFSKEDVLLPAGEVIHDKWRIIDKLGMGAYGAVYHVTASKHDYAMKIESKRACEALMKMEVAVLKTFRRHGRTLGHVCQFIGSGETPTFRYVVMELVGKSLWHLRNDRFGGRFSESTTVRLGTQCLEAIEAVHRIGFVHRDVKPANFAMGKGDRVRLVYILDFGLARQYITRNGVPRPPRKRAGFRGTLRYASANAHSKKDLGRHDDLWSWLYVLVEFQLGELPWCNISNKDEIGRMKKEIVADQLLKDMAPEFYKIMNTLHGLQFTDTPNYAWFHQQLTAITVRHKYKAHDPFDWES